MVRMLESLAWMYSWIFLFWAASSPVLVSFQDSREVAEPPESNRFIAQPIRVHCSCLAFWVGAGLGAGSWVASRGWSWGLLSRVKRLPNHCSTKPSSSSAGAWLGTAAKGVGSG